MNRAIGVALALLLGVVPNPPEPNTPTAMVCPYKAPVPFRCISWLRGTLPGMESA